MSLFVFKTGSVALDTPSPADSVFKVPEKTDLIQISESSLTLLYYSSVHEHLKTESAFLKPNQKSQVNFYD